VDVTVFVVEACDERRRMNRVKLSKLSGHSSLSCSRSNAKSLRMKETRGGDIPLLS